MSFLKELNEKKNHLKSAETVVTLPDGRRYFEKSNQPAPSTFGFVVDTKPDNVPAEIVKNLYLGSQDCCEQSVLRNYNIKSVLSVGIEPSFKFENITYKFVSCLDLPESNLRSVLDESVHFIKLNVDNNINVLVHCNAGVSRSSAIAIGYLMLEHQFTYDQAYTLVKKSRNCIKPNSGFVNQLKLLTPDF